MEHQRLNDLVYIKYNRALLKRYNERDTIDPIMLNDIDESNEWLTGRMEDDGDAHAEDDLVFEDDDLTWGDVARASGAEEPLIRTRANASSRITQPSKSRPSTSRCTPLTLIDEEDEMVNLSEQEDEVEGEWKLDDGGNHSDDDYVDLPLDDDE